MSTSVCPDWPSRNHRVRSSDRADKGHCKTNRGAMARRFRNGEWIVSMY